MSLAEYGAALKVDVVAVLRFVGYFDESEDAGVFSISGVFAPTHHWADPEAAWSAVLTEERIKPTQPNKAPEFKMEHCENRKGAFEDWDDPRERKRVQERFISVIADSPSPSPAGLAVAVDIEAFKTTLALRIASELPGLSYHKPYLFVFTRILAKMIELQQAANQALGANERIGLFFDEKKEFQGRALELYKQAKAAGFPLGACAFVDSTEHPGLQMADVLAYEFRRYLTETARATPPAPVRSQWSRLRASRLPGGTPRIYEDYFDAQTMRLVDAVYDSIP
ncbi:MAG: DUF3800 domain-containing protein [Candidatus Dormiibacterota bacterium]